MAHWRANLLWDKFLGLEGDELLEWVWNIVSHTNDTYFVWQQKATLLVILQGRAQKKRMISWTLSVWRGKLYGVDGIKNVCKSVSFSQGMWSAIKDHISRSDHGLEWPWGYCSPWTMEFCHLLISGGSQGNAKKIILNFRCFGVAFALQTLINHMCHISSQICHETGDSDVWLSIICGAHGNYKYYNNFWKLTKLMHCISL